MKPIIRIFETNTGQLICYGLNAMKTEIKNIMLNWLWEQLKYSQQNTNTRQNTMQTIAYALISLLQQTSVHQYYYIQYFVLPPSYRYRNDLVSLHCCRSVTDRSNCNNIWTLCPHRLAFRKMHLFRCFKSAAREGERASKQGREREQLEWKRCSLRMRVR